MWKEAYQLKTPELLRAITPVDTVQELFEFLALILAHRILTRVRRGLYIRSRTDDDDSDRR